MSDECKHTRKLCVSLRAQGGLTHPNVASSFVPKGWPDRTVICPWGLITLIECKDERGRLRSEQREQLGYLYKLGAPAWVVRFEADPPFKLRFERWDGVELHTLTDYMRWGLYFDAVKEILGD